MARHSYTYISTYVLHTVLRKLLKITSKDKQKRWSELWKFLPHQITKKFFFSSRIITNSCSASICNLCLDLKSLAQFVISFASICNLRLNLKSLSLELKCLLRFVIFLPWFKVAYAVPICNLFWPDLKSLKTCPDLLSPYWSVLFMLAINFYCFSFYKLFNLQELPNKFQNINHFWMVLIDFKEIKWIFL